MRGWLFDLYPEQGANTIVYWVKTRRGARRFVDRSFYPSIFVHSSPDRMDELEKALPIVSSVEHVSRGMKRLWLGEEEREVLEISIRDHAKVEDVAHMVDTRGKYKHYSLFNVDLRPSQRYFVEKDVFPMGLLEFTPKPTMMDDPYAMDYEIPPLSSTELAIMTEAKRGIPTHEDRLLAARVGADRIDGDEERVLRGVQDLLDAEDPDVVYTDDGDSFLMPYLYKRAAKLGLAPPRLGRDEDAPRTDRRGKSYFSYGQIKYKPPPYKLRGRIHIDRSSSFMYAESGLNGIIDLSRISSMPVQELSRLSPGTAISTMEVNQALRDGCVIMWKKNLPERFKTAEELVAADRGGFIYEPVVGIHDHVLEVDFTSLYPNIMVRFNISPETIMCSCCPEPARKVPGLGYTTCDRRIGLIPRVLKPVVERRTKLKRLIRDGAPQKDVYRERVNILKWLLVTCLDEGTEVPLRVRGRFGFWNIEDIVDRHARGVGEFPVRERLEAFGADGALSPALKKVSRVFRFPAPAEMIHLDIGVGELRMTPDHPCYVLRGGGLGLARADQVRKGDIVAALSPLYGRGHADGAAISGMVVKGAARRRPEGDHVYCLGVDEPLHGFALSNGVLTHNCFGYTGYRNARFGRIECHEAINAYGREIMVQTSEMAEAHGFEILHGIVDSLWLKGAGDPERFCEHVSGHIGIPLEPEGIYKWIVFLPGRMHGVGVLNRYYGLFEDGKLKLRGIELRRRDTTELVKDMQTDLLRDLSKASSSQQLLGMIPSALSVVEDYVDAVRSQSVPLGKMLVTRMVSQGLGEYRQFNDGVAALTQLDREGFDVNPGEGVRYLICDCRSKDPGKRVKVDSFLSGDEEYDAEAYVDLVLRGAEGLLLPFGYTKERLTALFGGKSPRKGQAQDHSELTRPQSTV